MPFLHLDDLSGDALVLSARGQELRSHPAVVVKADVPPPGAVWLGGPYWRVPSATPLATARALVAAGAADAFPDLVLHPVARWNDEHVGGQWYLDELGMDALYARSHGSADVRLAVVDSAIDIQHPDLAAKVSDPYDAFGEDDDPSPNPGEYCTDGSSDICDEHGTAVSGISAAIGDNEVGIVGLCPECTLVPIKLLGEGDGSLSADIGAYQHARDTDAWVINNSWGYTTHVPAPAMLASLIEEVATLNRDGLGAVVVFAAGNDDRRLRDDEIEALPHVLCVSAIDSYQNPTNYTNYGDPVDVAAPSATVSIAPGGGMTTTFGGTSAAAPVVAGLAGWALSIRPDLTGDEIAQLIIDTAVQSPLVVPDESGHADYYGYGVISPVGLWEALEPPTGDTGDTGDPADTGGDEPVACGCASPGGGVGLGALVPLVLLTVARRRA